jgi:hypothetical protein
MGMMIVRSVSRLKILSNLMALPICIVSLLFCLFCLSGALGCPVDKKQGPPAFACGP